MARIDFSQAEQRSLDWYRARLGCITGSRVADIMKGGRRKEDVFSQTAKAYLYQLAGERLLNETFVNDDDVFGDYVRQTSATTKAMQWGIDHEDAAKQLYMQIYMPEKELWETGSCAHPTIEHFAASPDGIVRDFNGCGGIGVLEVKCPTVGTFMQYFAEIRDAATLKAVKPEYYWQMQAEMDCVDACGGVFIAYCPWLTRPLHTAHIVRVEADIESMEQRVRLANEFIENINNNI